MKKEEIEAIAQSTLNKFKFKIKKPIFMFAEKKEFSKLLDNTPLQKHLEKTPCFVMEMKGGNVVYYCIEIIDNLTKGWRKLSKDKFVEAITVHEFLHSYNKIPVSDRGSAIFSESLVHNEMRREFPKLSRVLDKVELKSSL